MTKNTINTAIFLAALLFGMNACSKPTPVAPTAMDDSAAEMSASSMATIETGH